MGLFGSRRRRRRSQAEAFTSELPPQHRLREELGKLAALGGHRDLDAAESEAHGVVQEARRADLRDIKLIEKGRCPECRARTENFLYTTICPSCGWYRREVTEGSRSVVHLVDGLTIACDHVYRGGQDAYLCIRDGVVVAEVMRRSVQRIEHELDETELERARARAARLPGALCSWCQKPMTEAEEGGPWIDYVAFGATQERHVFCSLKCQKSFRRQYPSRVHRNCYETECADCDECVKRYDTHGFRRSIVS